MTGTRFRPFGASLDLAGARAAVVAPAPRPYRPARRRPLGQIEVRPEINAPVDIGIDLGTLPILIGSLGGAVVIYLLGRQIPGIRPLPTLAALGLAGFGIMHLFTTPAEAATPPEEVPGSAAPPPGGDASFSPPIAETSEEAFPLIEGRVVNPTEWQKVDVGMFAGSVPVQIRLTNPSSESITFDLMMEINEIPTPALFVSEEWNTQSTRVSLGAGETRDLDISIPLATWGYSVNQVDVYLTLRKRRISGGDAQLLQSRHFVVD